MDRLNEKSNPDLTNVDNVNLIKIKMDGQYGLNNDLSSKLKNQRVESKSIVNNKPSQFGPILGVNFHNIKR